MSIKKSPWVIDYDCGGCISGKTELIMENGDMITADELVNKKLEGNFISYLEDKMVAKKEFRSSMLSWDSYTPLMKKMTTVFKLKSPKEMISVKTRTGKMELTGNHKVLIDTENGQKWIEAKNLKPGQYVYCPSKIKIKSSLPELTLKIKKPNEDFMYLLGLIASDGHTIKIAGGKGYKICFDNNEDELIKLFREKCGKIAGKQVKVYSEKKQPNLKRCYFYSKNFYDNCKKLGISKEQNLKKIFKMPEKHISFFIAGYFDGDGSIEINKRGTGEKRYVLSFAIKNEDTAKQMSLLLKRLGIKSAINSSLNKSSFGERTMHALRISTKEDILNFMDIVPFKHPEKVRRKLEIRKEVEKRKKMGRNLAAPLLLNKRIKELRKSRGIKLKQMHYDASVIQKIERMNRTTKPTINKIYENIKDCLPEKEKEEIENMLSCDYYLDEIKTVERVRSGEEFVYNFEVEGTHNYIPANGFVVSNCNGCNLEIFALLTPKYDIERFGCKYKSSPRNADVLIVQGCLNKKAVSRLKKIYSQMADDKIVMSVGSCAITGGPFKECYNFAGPIDKHVKVDVYVPGCPPRPEAIIDGLIKALKKVK